MFARVLLYCSIPLVLVLAWVAWDRARIEVDLAAVSIGEAVDAAPATLALERVVEIKVNTHVAGRVVESTLRTGKTVKAGEVLFTLAPADRPDERVPVTAAFDGVITTILVRPGESVPAYAPLARLWNGRPEVVARVAPADFVNIAVGLEAEVRLPNVSEGWVAARVLKVPSHSDENGGDFRLVLGLDLADEELIAGLTGEALIVRRRIPDTLLIPAEAVQADGTVLMVDGKRVRRAAVQTGLPYRGKVQVLGGLKTGDAVIVRSAVPLIGGERIRVRGY